MTSTSPPTCWSSGAAWRACGRRWRPGGPAPRSSSSRRAGTGTAGVVAAVGAGGGYIVPGDERQRQGMLSERHKEAAGLDDLEFLERVYRQSWESFQRMPAWGYQPPNLGAFGADSMFFLRRQARRSGVRLLDHSPALELLADRDGVVTGAAGVQRQTDRTWRVRAGAVILATGGTAFLSGAQGTNGCTGDGYLMAAEAGASFIGMEFATSYALAPLDSTTTKGGMYFQGHAYDDRGRRLDPELPAWFSIPNVAEAIREGRQPYYVLDKVPPARREPAGRFAPNFYQNFERRGINPFEEFWPVTLMLEGSVRASGGIAIDEGCETGTPGLYAVGDVADKSRLTGAFPGRRGAVRGLVRRVRRMGGRGRGALRRGARPPRGRGGGPRPGRRGAEAGGAGRRAARPAPADQARPGRGAAARQGAVARGRGPGLVAGRRGRRVGRAAPPWRRRVRPRNAQDPRGRGPDRDGAVDPQRGPGPS
ncbi:MAG: FAD-binding protein [Caulobacteraceae bacterium]